MNKNRTLDNYSRGENHHFSVLTQDQVKDIRKEYQKGERGKGIRVLARKYNVYPNTIYSIIHEITWKKEGVSFINKLQS